MGSVSLLMMWCFISMHTHHTHGTRAHKRTRHAHTLVCHHVRSLSPFSSHPPISVLPSIISSLSPHSLLTLSSLSPRYQSAVERSRNLVAALQVRKGNERDDPSTPSTRVCEQCVCEQCV